MGWYKQACSQCWDNHDGLTCEEFQQRASASHAAYEQQRLMREQNELIRQQNELMKLALDRKA